MRSDTGGNEVLLVVCGDGSAGEDAPERRGGADTDSGCVGLNSIPAPERRWDRVLGVGLGAFGGGGLRT